MDKARRHHTRNTEKRYWRRQKLNGERGYPIDFRPDYALKSEEYLQYAEVYKDAIQNLLNNFSMEPPFHDYSLAPVLLLLRQYIELQLKGIIFYEESHPNVIGNHDIVFLYREAIKAVEKKYGTELLGKSNPDVEKFIMLLGKFDPKGEASRYPETRDGHSLHDKIEKMDSWLYEQITSLSALIQISAKIFGDLEGIEGYLDLMKENKEESYANR